MKSLTFFLTIFLFLNCTLIPPRAFGAIAPLPGLILEAGEIRDAFEWLAADAHHSRSFSSGNDFLEGALRSRSLSPASHDDEKTTHAIKTISGASEEIPLLDKRRIIEKLMAKSEDVTEERLRTLAITFYLYEPAAEIAETIENFWEEVYPHIESEKQTTLLEAIYTYPWRIIFLAQAYTRYKNISLTPTTLENIREACDFFFNAILSPENSIKDLTFRHITPDTPVHRIPEEYRDFCVISKFPSGVYLAFRELLL